MVQKSEIPLEMKKLYLFKGDWDRLSEIIAPARLKPSRFIRHLIRKKIIELESALAEAPQATAGEIDLEDLSND